jgi:hypothetical protein
MKMGGGGTLVQTSLFCWEVEGESKHRMNLTRDLQGASMVV